MKSYKISEAKARFAAVVEEAAAGEEIIVTKMGKTGCQSGSLCGE